MSRQIPILVACNLDCASSTVPVTGVLETYMEAVEAGGGLPFVVPASTDEARLNAYLDMAGGLMMPGGIDVWPMLYGQGADQNIGRLDPRLDEYQGELIRLARKRSMPIFGICRGIQIINVALGGTLIQHIPSAPSHVSHRQTMDGKWAFHTVTAVPGSFIADVFGTKFAVNSFHHQALDRVADGFRVTAVSQDGVIEAIESDDGQTIAVQWHPERMIWSQPDELELFRRFVAASARYLE